VLRLAEYNGVSAYMYNGGRLEKAEVRSNHNKNAIVFAV
jgi:hypothetical protein